ncbi:MAG: Fe-S-cluster containining protein [Desulforhopalus sp.]|jgi:Fe-S-cluster containining protein
MSVDNSKDDGMNDPIGNAPFTFACHSGVSCFTFCCKNVDLTLYPFDIIRLKTALGIDSEDFIRSHTFLIKGDNPFFPTVKLKLQDSDQKECPFLSTGGCTVYGDRPSACRTYPLERGVMGKEGSSDLEEVYFLTHHDYCKGHFEEDVLEVKSWIRSQQLLEYNTMNSLWAEIDILFRGNPWMGEGAGGEKQQLSFMVCYNIDGFRRFCSQHNLLKQFKLPKDFKNRIKKEDGELQKFGFEWLKLILTGKSSLIGI